MDYIIGIDAGTSKIKAVLFDRNGQEILSEAMTNAPVYRDGGCAEQDMNRLWAGTARCIQKILQRGQIPKEAVLGIGITGQGEGLWLIDDGGEPLQNAILWCDGRAVKEVDAVVQAHPEIGDRIYRTTGTRPVTGSSLMLLKWMQKNRKAVLDKGAAVFFCKDWIRYRLTGNVATDFTDAGTAFLNIRTGEPDEAMLETLQLAACKAMLATPLASDRIAGTVTREAAEVTGLAEGTPVITGAMDVVAATLGAGVIHDGEISLMLGTTCAQAMCRKKETACLNLKGRSCLHSFDPAFCLELVSTANGTQNIDWMLQEIAVNTGYEQIDSMIQNVPPGCGGVIFHPYIGSAGERAPFYHPYAKAGFFGISTATRRETLMRAVYEGIAFSIKDCLQQTDTNSCLCLTGGGAASSTLAQMIADVTGMAVSISDGKEFAAKGAAMMYGVAAGIYSDYEEAVRQACRVRKKYYPGKQQKLYRDIYALYRDIRLALDALWTERSQILKKIQ